MEHVRYVHVNKVLMICYLMKRYNITWTSDSSQGGKGYIVISCSLALYCMSAYIHLGIAVNLHLVYNVRPDYRDWPVGSALWCLGHWSRVRDI